MVTGTPNGGKIGRRLASRRAKATRKKTAERKAAEASTNIRPGPDKKDQKKPDDIIPQKSSVVEIPKNPSLSGKSLGEQAEDILNRFNYYKVRHILTNNDEIPSHITIGHLRRSAKNTLGSAIEQGGPESIQVVSDKYGLEATNWNGKQLELKHVTEVISGKT